MPDPRRPPNNNDELDDDDEDGSKAEEGDYEDVRHFDEEQDLGPATKSKSSPNKSSPATQPANNTANKKGRQTVITNNADLDSPQALQEVNRIVSIPWPAAAGKRPPRDMKRLDLASWYVVCKVMKWGDTPALFVRGAAKSEDDYGFYKPPAQYYSYHFQIGDRIQVSQLGYSSSRNRVATSIRVKPTHMFEVPMHKMNWVAPPIPDGTIPSESKAKKKEKANLTNNESVGAASSSSAEHYHPHVIFGSGNNSHASSLKRRRIREEVSAPPHRSSLSDLAPAIQNLAQSPMGMGPHGQKRDKIQAFPMFSQQQLYSTGQNGLVGQTGVAGLSAHNIYAFQPATPDINRAGSFSNYLTMDMFASSANLLPPSSPNLLGANSPLMGGAGQPSMHRIASTGGFGSFSMISSPSTNCPPFSFRFPSASNMSFGADPASGN
jgi:hypothetical protein